MREWQMLRPDDGWRSRPSDIATAQGKDVSPILRQALIRALDWALDTPVSTLLSHPEDCLAFVISHASPVAERRLAEAFARLDRLRTRQRCTRLWLVAETLALWVARVEPRTHAADE
jgi:hypothetical protein